MNTLLHYILTISMICTLFISDIHSKEEVVVLAGSDYQGENHAKSAQHVTDILQTMEKDGIKKIDGLLFAGDYTVQLDSNGKDSKKGMASLKTTVRNMYPSLKEENIVLEQGNHDTSKEAVQNAQSGLYTFDSYSVYVINEKDFPWENKDDKTHFEFIDRKSAKKLEKALASLSEKKYKKPVFILCHVPLHLTERTSLYGDGEYGKYIFDVLNKYGQQGLNLFFLYGHNHSKGCENYLGGAAVFLKKGDEICIPVVGCKNGKNKERGVDYTTETLNFTYMNAGYVGYYRDQGQSDGCLTMTSFKIDEKKVEIARYSKEGIHELKSKGMHANNYPKMDNTLVYASPQVVYLE